MIGTPLNLFHQSMKKRGTVTTNPGHTAMPAHAETRHVPYSARQMYDLVADVARYPEFLPWTAAARIRSVTEQGDKSIMLADLVVSFKVFRERFGSRVVLYPEARKIDTEYLDGPFKHMISNWTFEDAETGCDV